MRSRGAENAPDSTTETDNPEGLLSMTQSLPTKAGQSDDTSTNADTTEPITLTSLPPELVHRVCDHIEDDDDILSLLLAYKDGSLQVDDYFLDHHMSHRRHLVTKYSLETLVKITECPQLIRRMQSLTLVVAETTSESRYLFVASNYRDRTEPPTEKQKAVWTKWCAEYDTLANGEDVRLLAAALSNLKHAGIIPALVLDHPKNWRSPAFTFGLRQLGETLGVPLTKRNMDSIFELGMKEYSKSASLLLQGIAQAQYPIKALTLGEGWFIHFNPKTFAKNLDTIGDLRFCLSSLTKLDWTMDKIEYRCETTEAALLSLQNVMKLATGLKTLRLRFSGEQRYENERGGFEAPFADVFKHNQLKSLTIESSMMEPKELFYFLDQHCATLEELGITDCNFFDCYECEWPEVLRTIACSLPALTHCRIEGKNCIKADDVLDVEVLDEHWAHYIWDFKGIGVVKEKLKLMAESVRISD